jgi:hypothetical protein
MNLILKSFIIYNNLFISLSIYIFKLIYIL